MTFRNSRHRRALGAVLSLLTLMALPAYAAEDGYATEDSRSTCGDLDGIEEWIAEADKRGWIGFGYEHSVQNPGHFTVNYIHSESAAELAGLRKGDILTGIDSTHFDSSDFARAQQQLGEIARGLAPGQKAVFHILRDGSPVEVQLEPLAHRAHALATFLGWKALDRYYRQNPEALSTRR